MTDSIVKKLKLHVKNAEAKVASGSPPNEMEGKKEELRQRLREALSNAGGSAEGLAEVQAVAGAAKAFQEEEYSFDEDLLPALEFMECMGQRPGDIFTLLATDLAGILASELLGADLRVTAEVLQDMQQRAASSKVASMLLGVLNSVESPKAAKFLSYFSPTLFALEKQVQQSVARSPIVIQQLPESLKMRLVQENELPAKIHQQVTLYIKNLRRGMVPTQRLSEDLGPLMSLTGGRGEIMRNVIFHLKRLHRKAVNYDMVSLREPREEPENSSEDVSGRPLSHGPDPFLSTLRRQLVLSAIHQQKLKRSAVGDWKIESTDGKHTLHYVLRLAAGYGGTLVGTSTLTGCTHVLATVEGGVLRFELHLATTVYYSECRLSSDDMTLLGGKWHSKNNKSRGSFTGQRKGRAQFVDNRHVEWDNMSEFIHETERLLHGQKLAHYDLRVKDFQPLIKAVQNLQDTKVLSASKTEADISFCLADPYVLQLLVDALVKQVVTRTPGEVLSQEAGFLLIMLHVAAQNSSSGREGGESLLTRKWNTATLKSLGYRADHLAAALRCFHNEEDLLKSDFRQYMDASWICALQARKQHDERPMTTLRLLVAILISKAFESQKKTHLDACLQVAAKWKQSPPKLKAAKASDWIDQLLVDWLVNTCRSWPNVASVLRVPLLSYFMPLALEDPYLHSRIVGFFNQVYTEFCRSSEETKYMAKCFNGAIKNEHYDWSWELACTYLPLIEEKRYLHEAWNKSPIGKVFPAVYGQNGECLSLVRQRPQAVVVISDEPDNVTKPRKTLEAVDSVLGLRVAQTVHQYCKNASTFCNITMSQAAAQAMEMLTENYQGMPSICTMAASWIARLRAGKANADPLVEQRITLRGCLAKRMVYHFDPERADRLTNRSQPSPSVPWVPDFINVKEWRETIYNLANESRGRSSRFVSGLLYEIGEAGKNFDELLTENSTSESFQLFTRKMRELILRVLTVANMDETLVQDDLDALCATATHKQYTYVYSQGILRQLISMCPSQRQPLRCLNQVLTEYHKENHSALRMDLRLSSVGQYPELSQLLHSMCRFGGSPHFDAKDVKDLCHKVEVLIDKPDTKEEKKRKMEEAQVTARPSKRAKQEPKASPKKRKNEFLHLKDRANTGEMEEEGKTEVASSADSWGHEKGTPRTPFSAKEAKGAKMTKNVAKTEVSSEASATERTSGRTSGRTASVFNMPAPSNYAREERDESDPTTGMRGVLETLRSKVFFEALLTRFVDPSSTLKVTPVQRHSYARLMALCCHDGLLADPESQSRRNAQKAVVASTKNLEACHILANDSVTSWYRKMPKMMEQQKTVLGCAAVLRWLQCVVLSDKLSGHQLLVRMAQPLTFMILRGGWTANPKKATAGVILKILRQIIESLPSTATVTAKELREDEPLTRAAQGDQEASLHTGEPSVLRQRTCEHVAGLLVFLASSADLRVPVIDLVRSTAKCWEGGLKDFIVGFLSSNGPPLSRRTCWSMTLLLATKPVLDICKASAKGELGKQVVEFCKFARDAMSHSDPSQPTVVQRRQSDATEAFRVLQQAFEVGLPESRLKPMPKGRSGKAAPAQVQALQGKWNTRLGPLEVKGHTATVNGKTEYTIRIEDGVASCGGYQTTPVAGSSRITWKRTDGSNKQIEWIRVA